VARSAQARSKPSDASVVLPSRHVAPATRPRIHPRNPGSGGSTEVPPGFFRGSAKGPRGCPWGCPGVC
jgi:hypothetical protein